MTPEKLEEFLALITARLSALAEDDARGQGGQSIVKLDQQAIGRLSRMDAMQNQAMAKAGQLRRDLEEKRLTNAMERIKQGEFGTCEECGDEIADGRLKLDPAATLCISCAKG